MNKMVQDIDQVTDRDMYLVREASKNIRNLLDEADKKIGMFSEASMRLRSMIAESEKISKATSTIQESFAIPETKAAPKTAAPVKRKSLTNSQINSYLKNTQAASRQYNSETSYEISPSIQQDLFNQEVSETVLKDETTITPDGAAYKEVPLINTQMYEDKPVPINEDNILSQPVGYPQESPMIINSIQEIEKPVTLKSKVIDLHRQGYKSDEIATALSCSITEVDFIIDML